ncbi:o-succinylbenzoate synthase [Aquimarina sp. ERC-38]|uniref:o-succinylbenzoate synthase n=1 Tax=Aquimarina sp. ERC-38 TaxID=2949996 RepID=UPI002246CAB9|nr:o-succinylbenzoate synthase [Aquimarina sp. ERC-38]UZO80204.1 o-succinylbenzoate synthase [Aquimarina sp. ERC-38]
MTAAYQKYVLKFKRPSGTSRGVLKTKETWFLLLKDGDKEGIGECGILRGLSMDDVPGYEEKLQWVCKNIDLGKDQLWEQLLDYPSIQFGVEMAFSSLQSKHSYDLFPSSFSEGKENIPINGLIWMGDKAFMKEQISQKLEEGFSCIKMKIGAIDFKKELALLESIRFNFSANQIELRVDANGAFNPSEAIEKLKQLSQYQLHSIEQPIKPRQIKEMQRLCAETPLPIALDEELIGVLDKKSQQTLLETIQPQYIILKPSLIGGIKGTNQWIENTTRLKIGWWVTSALESNVGLNAIARYTYTLQNNMPQGLGTGGLYTNNIDSPLYIKNGTLGYDPNKKWSTNILKL